MERNHGHAVIVRWLCKPGQCLGRGAARRRTRLRIRGGVGLLKRSSPASTGGAPAFRHGQGSDNRCRFAYGVFMPQGRPAIPQPMQRQVRVEAGHRCAIPTCRATPVELAHIRPYAQVLEHTLENLIALCPTCHTRFDRGDIDRESMRQYKANLGLLSGRYGPLELQALQWFADDTSRQEIDIPRGVDWAFGNLTRDGLAVVVDRPPTWGSVADGSIGTVGLQLTDAGHDAVRRLLDAQPLE
ncbi:HNH endonuclease signature motif containing protein [Streptomyces sp. NPDC002668]|uniref:HNH endonuclease signature motif containing protein n=1 Tax=Streptomyces sp. NPDC002668 TaxID=3154422 RepID=UPI0033341E31